MKSNNNKMCQNNNSILFRKYSHDIRNMKYLNKEAIINIDKMSNEEKIEIIILFNNVVDNLKYILELDK